MLSSSQFLYENREVVREVIEKLEECKLPKIVSMDIFKAKKQLKAAFAAFDKQIDHLQKWYRVPDFSGKSLQLIDADMRKELIERHGIIYSGSFTIVFDLSFEEVYELLGGITPGDLKRLSYLYNS